MKSIVFFNNKGGVGKTTLLCNVAAYAAQELKKKVCVIDADPQCNATQYFFSEDEINEFYDKNFFNINDIVVSLELDGSYTSKEKIDTKYSVNFELDVIIGSPDLALSEDLLATDWSSAKSGEIRGIRTSLVFDDLLLKLENKYDLIFIDVSPSLGAINRAILLASDYFVSPMSIDIFSLKAFDNISKWLNDWQSEWDKSLRNVKKSQQSAIQNYKLKYAKFIGYVTQQYLAKKDKDGNRRAVKAYENIGEKIDDIIKKCSLYHLTDKYKKIEIGTVPNLFSLIPMSQSNNKPVFNLSAKDGVVGAHFAKVNDAKEIFKQVTQEIMERING